MKGLVASIVAFAILTLAAPAMAYVVMVTTSIPVADLTDEAQLKTALSSAVEDVLANAIGFTPTIVTLEEVRVLGDRLHLLLLIADADGEKSIDALTRDEPSSEEQEQAEPSREIVSPPHAVTPHRLTL